MRPARQVRADRGPARVARAPVDLVRPKVPAVHIGRILDERAVPVVAIPRIDPAGGRRPRVAAVVREDEISVLVLGPDVIRVLGMHEGLEPVPAEDLVPVVGGAGHGPAGAVVLGAEIAGVGVARIERDAVRLRHGQIVELRPGGAAVGGPVDAAVVAFIDDGIGTGSEVEAVMIHVHASGGVLVRRAAVGAPVEGEPQHVDRVGVGGMCPDVAAPPPVRGERPVERAVVGPAPVEPAIGGPVQAVEVSDPVRIDGVHDMRLRLAQAQTDPAAVGARRRQAAAHLAPGIATVGGAVDRATRASVVVVLGLTQTLPHRRVKHIRIIGPHDQIHAARLGVDMVHALPCDAAVRRPVDPALETGLPEIAHDGHEDPVGIGGIDPDAPDGTAVFEPDKLPVVTLVE